MALTISTETLAQMRQTRGVASPLVLQHVALVEDIERLEAWISARTS